MGRALPFRSDYGVAVFLIPTFDVTDFM